MKASDQSHDGHNKAVGLAELTEAGLVLDPVITNRNGQNQGKHQQREQDDEDDGSGAFEVANKALCRTKLGGYRGIQRRDGELVFRWS